MELRHLRYFAAVAEEQNVTRAAERLHVSQPPLSRQIRDLEEELGVSLFQRSGRSVRLTQAGRVFLDEARAVLTRAAEATRTVRAFASGERGEIHVGYAPSLTVELLPRALRAFERAASGVRVTLHDLSTEEMLEGLRKKRLDVALMIQSAPRALTGLVFEELCRYAVCVAAPSRHRLAAGARPNLARVLQDRLIAYSRSDYPEYHQWLADLIGGAPIIAEEHDSASSLIAAVEAGRGVALVPQSFSCFAGFRLKIRPLIPAPPPFVVGMAWKKGEVSAIVQVFMAGSRRIAAAQKKH